MLCDRTISARVKGKVLKSVVRPAVLYGAETWSIKRAQENKLEDAEIRMLRWMVGVTRRDKVRNNFIGGTTKVTEVTKKVLEIVCNGSVISKGEKKSMSADGRPKKRWKDCIGEDLRERGLSGEEVGDRVLWRKLVRNSDPI